MKGDKNGGPGACPWKISKTTPFATLENGIFCQSSRHNYVLSKSISRNNDQTFDRSRCTAESSITNSRVENIKITKSRA